MSRSARARAGARPWMQQRDAADADADHVEDILAMVNGDSDEHLREIAWQQREHEQQQRSEA